MESMGSEDWQVLVSLFPPEWQDEATRSGAVARLRGFESAEALLRTILLHVARGYSLRETVAHAQAAQWTTVSDVALLKRLRSAEAWLRTLCLALLKENGVALEHTGTTRRVRLIDGTIVREPGKTGSNWRILYSLQLPSLQCDYFDLTPDKGVGTGEALDRVPVRAGDLLLADAGYSRIPGIEHVVQHKADVIVRVNPVSLPFWNSSGRSISLLARLRQLSRAGQIGDWKVALSGKRGWIAGRVCALRKSATAIQKAENRLQRKASKGQFELRPETLEYAKYVVVFTTWRNAAAVDILDWYRVRWQIELAFKRLKSLAQFGHLPKYDDRSSRAWLYGKLFVALLAQKLVRTARELSPWGYSLLHLPQ